jgi:hypothetical protein
MVLKINKKKYKGVFAYGTFTLFGPAFQQGSTNQPLFFRTSKKLLSYNHHSLLALARYGFALNVSEERMILDCSLFARRYLGNTPDARPGLFSFPPGTKMFHFPGLPHRATHENPKSKP